MWRTIAGLRRWEPQESLTTSIPSPAAGCRLPRREDLDPEGQRVYDRLANPDGGTLRGLKGPGGIQLHSPELAQRSRPVNHYLRYEAGLGGRVRELAILATAREHDSQFEWAAHEPAALAEGIPPELIDTIRWRGDTAGLAEADAIVIDLAREIFAAAPRLRRRPTPAPCSNSVAASLSTSSP